MPRPLLVSAILTAALAIPSVAAPQVVDVREPYPAVTADGRDWLRNREPILFAGERYLPSGPTVHFQPDVMVPTGSYDGVPLYADTSLEPYSQILVPIGRGLLQPYERPREGNLAGTTGSRTPSFPVALRPDVPVEGLRPDASLQGGQWPDDSLHQRPPQAPRTSIPAPAPSDERQPGIVSAREPEGNRGIWISYEGRRWQSAGDAVARDPGFKKVGEYRGFPVYVRDPAPAGEALQIYIPSRDDMLAPYKAVTG